jgi:hypothetical protein
VHLALTALDPSGGPGAWTGYEWPYQFAVGGTTLLASFLGLAFLYGICRFYADPRSAGLATALLFLGTTIVFYSAIEVAMAHGLATAAVAGLVWYWLKSYGSHRLARWLLVGVLVGVAGLMRWQLVTFALLPMGEAALKWARCRRVRNIFSWRQPLAGLVVAGLGSVIAFSPQLLTWRIVYGSWTAMPLTTAHNWMSPSWQAVLISSDRGFFNWTPLTLVALSGFICLANRKAGLPLRDRLQARSASEGMAPPRSLSGFGFPHVERDPIPTAATKILLAAFALQVYVVASLWGEEVYLGVSFGFRHLTESVVALAPGVALLLARISRRWFRMVGGFGCLLVFWNLLLIAQYRYGLVPAAGGAELGDVFVNAVWLIGRKKLWLVVPAAAGPVLLWVLLGRRTSAVMKLSTAGENAPPDRRLPWLARVLLYNNDTPGSGR